MSKRYCITQEDAASLSEYLVGLPLPFSVSIGGGLTRTKSQNALLHKWYGEIAAQLGDTDAHQVKGECHRKWGLTIRLRDEVFAFVWKRSAVGLNYEQECKFLASGALNVSSAMSPKELTEYMDAMSREYRLRGFFLTDPELQKYEVAA